MIETNIETFKPLPTEPASVVNEKSIAAETLKLEVATDRTSSSPQPLANQQLVEFFNYNR